MAACRPTGRENNDRHGACAHRNGKRGSGGDLLSCMGIRVWRFVHMYARAEKIPCLQVTAIYRHFPTASPRGESRRLSYHPELETSNAIQQTSRPFSIFPSFNTPHVAPFPALPAARNRAAAQLGYKSDFKRHYAAQCASQKSVFLPNHMLGICFVSPHPRTDVYHQHPSPKISRGILEGSGFVNRSEMRVGKIQQDDGRKEEKPKVMRNIYPGVLGQTGCRQNGNLCRSHCAA